MARERKIGDPYEEGVAAGPVINNSQMERILGYIQSGKDQGATLEVGGERLDRKGYFIQPTIFSGVTDEMKISQEEIFGPVMSVLKFSTVEEAIKRANDSIYGLAGGV